jgi:colanic acid biosynthesis glycosyl transferase WcaI
MEPVRSCRRTFCSLAPMRRDAMRILALGINYWPEKTGIAVYSVARCEHLARRGHEVSVVTGLPYYPEWRILDGYARRPWRREARNGVNILRAPLFVPARVTSLKRVLHEASFLASSALRAFAGERPDAVFVVSPPLGLGLVARALARWWGVPYVFHVEDLQPDAAGDLGMIRNRRLLEVLYQVERSAYAHASVVSTLNEAMARRIREKGVAAQKVRVLAHGADPRLFDVPLSEGGESFRREHQLEGKFLVVHAGNMGVKQGLDVVLECARRSLADPSLVYLLIGDGAVRRHLEDQCRAARLENVRFLPVLSDEEFFEMLGAMDVGLVTQQRAVSDVLFPSKLESLLAAGRPVIASVNETSEVARVVAESRAGTVVAAEDPALLSTAISDLRREASVRRAMAEQGRSYARKRWSSEAALGEVERVLVELVDGTPRDPRLSASSAR